MNSRFLHIHEGVNVQAHSHETFLFKYEKEPKTMRRPDRPHYKQGIRPFSLLAFIVDIHISSHF